MLTLNSPHPSIYKHVARNEIRQVLGEKQYLYDTDRIVYPRQKGILSYFKTVLFPRKCFPYPEAVSAINVVKRNTMTWMSVFSSKYIIPAAIGFLLTPWKGKLALAEKFLQGYVRTNEWILAPHFFQNRFYCECTRGLRQLIVLFLKEIGIQDKTARDTAHIFSVLIEYDDAYRYRVEDIFSMTTKEQLMADPRKELQRMLKIFKQREKQVFHKFSYFTTVLNVLLVFPKFRNALKKAVGLTDIRLLQLDDIDSYWCLNRDGYDFFGQPVQIRFAAMRQMYMEKTGKMPTLYEVTV